MCIKSHLGALIEKENTVPPPDVSLLDGTCLFGAEAGSEFKGVEQLRSVYNQWNLAFFMGRPG